MKRQVAFTVFYPHPPERVWKALTDPKALRRWLMPTDFRPRLGQRFRFRRPEGAGEETTISCEVVALESARRLAYTWCAEQEEHPTLVTWTLEPVEGGTRVHLEHTGLEELTMTLETDQNWKMALRGTLPSTLRQANRPHRTRRMGRIIVAGGDRQSDCIRSLRMRIGARGRR